MHHRHPLPAPTGVRTYALRRLVAGLLLSASMVTGTHAAETGATTSTDPATLSPTAIAMSRMSIAGFKKGAREDADTKPGIVACVQRIDDAVLAPALTRDLRGKFTDQELRVLDAFFADTHGRHFVEVIVDSARTGVAPDMAQGTPFAAALEAFEGTPAAQKLFSSFGKGSPELKQIFITELLPLYQACDPTSPDDFTPPTLQEDN